jgi:hypothetical protein
MLGPSFDYYDDFFLTMAHPSGTVCPVYSSLRPDFLSRMKAFSDTTPDFPDFSPVPIAFDGEAGCSSARLLETLLESWPLLFYLFSVSSRIVTLKSVYVKFELTLILDSGNSNS